MVNFSHAYSYRGGNVNAQTLFLSQNKNTSPRVTDRTNYTKTASRACTKTRDHKKLELKKQNKLCLNTHICAWNFAHNLWKDLRTHFHFCLLSFLVAPFVHRAACASWPRGLGFSRTRLDTSNSLSKGQHPPSARSLSSTGTTLIPARPSSLVQQATSEYFVSTSDTL